MSRKHSFTFINEQFKSRNYELLETEYFGVDYKMNYKCPVGHFGMIRYHDFQKGHGCAECVGTKKLTYQQVYDYFQKQGCKLIETKYKNNHTPMQYECECGKVSSITFGNFQSGQRCKDCGYKTVSEKMMGDKNSSWKHDKLKLKLSKQIRIKSYNLLYKCLKLTGQEKIDKTETLLGYTRQQLLEHVTSHPNWEYCKNLDNWHLDHIEPITAFIEHGITDLKIINAIDNLQPLSPDENMAKHDKYNKEEFIKKYKYLITT